MRRSLAGQEPHSATARWTNCCVGSFNWINSRKEITRNGVSFHIAGSNSGMASTSATVVVPLRNNIAAPAFHDAVNSAGVHWALNVTIALIQSAKLRGGEIFPAIAV